TGAVVTAKDTVTRTYTVTGTDTNGCSNTATRLVLAKVQPKFQFASGSICSGSGIPMTLLFYNSPNILYSWTPGAGLSGTIGIPTCSTQVTRTYTVTGNLNGCKAIQTVTITVDSVPQACIT